MAVTLKRDLLGYHSTLHFRLVHAAIGSYPVQGKNTLMANRMLMVFEDSDGGSSFIHDCASGDSFTLQPGTVYFIPCQHEVDMKLTEGLLFVSFQFNLDFYYGIDVFRNYGRCVPINMPEMISEVRHIFERKVDAGILCRINEILFGLCSVLLEKNHGAADINHLTASQYAAILDYVHEHGDATTTVASLALMNGMRQDVFSRKFTRDMNITPKELIDNTLTRKAIQLLMGSALSIKEIANNLHFSSECYFSRYFKKHTGASPRIFRHSHGNR